jgi:hypothetical protein
MITALTRARLLSVSSARSVHSISSFVKIHFNLILQSVPRSSKWSISLRLLNQSTVNAYSLSYTCYRPRLSHCSRFYQPVQTMKLIVMHSPPRPNYPPNIFLSTLFSDMRSLCFSPSVRDQVSLPYASVTTSLKRQ